MSYTTIDNPELYFQVKTYAGNNSGSGQAITFDGSENMQPDFVWVKCRDVGHSHTLYDSVRTSPAKNFLKSDDNIAERTVALGSFDSNGVTFTNNDGFNNGSGNYVIWSWKAGTSFTNDASSTGIGTIDSAGSFNNDSGFSIVSYTGTGSLGTIKHGLNSVPKMIIIKSRSAVKDWTVYHNSISAENYLELNQTLASTDSSSVFNDTAPTSSVFSVGTNGQTNGSSTTYIAYCFAEKKGYSKFGSYTGNGQSGNSAPFIYTGFKPAMVICKKSSASGSNWGIIDNKRANSFNQISAMLNPNSSGTEGANNNCDFVSNGFKWRTNDGNSNDSATYIYMAFAENPFVTSTGIPTTAR